MNAPNIPEKSPARPRGAPEAGKMSDQTLRRTSRFINETPSATKGEPPHRDGRSRSRSRTRDQSKLNKQQRWTATFGDGGQSRQPSRRSTSTSRPQSLEESQLVQDSGASVRTDSSKYSLAPSLRSTSDVGTGMNDGGTGLTHPAQPPKTPAVVDPQKKLEAQRDKEWEYRELKKEQQQRQEEKQTEADLKRLKISKQEIKKTWDEDRKASMSKWDKMDANRLGLGGDDWKVMRRQGSSSQGARSRRQDTRMTPKDPQAQ